MHGCLYADAPVEHYRVEERDHRIVQQPWGGYTRHNRIVRVCTAADGSEQETVLAVNHAIMLYAPLLSAEEEATLA